MIRLEWRLTLSNLNRGDDLIDFFKKLFSTDDFPARWHCGNWGSGHGWLHIISDIAIFLAYFAIPVALIIFSWKKHKEILNTKLVWLCASFILLCGFTHLIEATIFWNPVYRFSGLMKALTAVVSCFTAISIIRVLPQALTLPGFLKMTQTIEKQEEVNRKLKQSNEDLDQFAYVASHDLRTPLRSIDKLASWISEDCNGRLPEKSLHHLTLLRNRVNRMDNMLHDLLQYSQADRKKARYETVDSGELIESILHHSFRDVYPEAKFDVAGEMPTFVAQRVPLEHCLHNLISNAVKHHNREDGIVQISAKEEPMFIEFLVSDDGPGIPLEYQDKIFELFETLKPRDVVEGSGMGLAIVKRLVSRMKGEIEIESTFGKGATFRIILPKIEKDPPVNQEQK